MFKKTAYRKHLALGLILLLALASRLAVAGWLGNRMEVLEAGGTHDQVSYDMLARRVATGYGFTFPEGWYPWVPPDVPTSYYSGSMVIHLAAIYKLVGYNPIVPRILYALLGTGIVYLMYRLGRRLFGERVGLIAAALGAAYAYLILYSAVLLTETPFIFFLFLTLDTGYSLVESRNSRMRRLLLLGIAMSGMLLFRMAALPFLIALLIWVGIRSHQERLSLRAVQLLVPLLIVVLAVAPWTLRNYHLFGRFMLLESQFGHVFWNGNHPDRPADWGEVSWVAPIPEDLQSLNEVDLTNELLRRGQEAVLRDPVRFLGLTLGRAKIFFMFWPSPKSSLISNVARVLSFGIMLPLMLYGLYLSRRYWKDCAPLYLFLLLHLGVYLASWVMIRYRIPADAVLLLFAALAIDELWRRIGYARARAA